MKIIRLYEKRTQPFDPTNRFKEEARLGSNPGMIFQPLIPPPLHGTRRTTSLLILRRRKRFSIEINSHSRNRKRVSVGICVILLVQSFVGLTLFMTQDSLIFNPNNQSHNRNLTFPPRSSHHYHLPLPD